MELALGGDYEWSVFGDSTAYVGGQVAYTGDRARTSAIAEPDRQHPRWPSRQLHDPRPAAGLLLDNWSLELYGKNVTDERRHQRHRRTGNFPNGAAGIAMIRPRTVGLSLGVAVLTDGRRRDVSAVRNVGAAGAGPASLVLALPAPYLLFLGDVTEAGYAKTAFGLRDWARELCVGEFAMPGGTVTTGLPRLTPREAQRAARARSSSASRIPAAC